MDQGVRRPDQGTGEGYATQAVAALAAKYLGYDKRTPFMSGAAFNDVWRPSKFPQKVKKKEMLPRIDVWPASLKIVTPQWACTINMHGKVGEGVTIDGLGFFGWGEEMGGVMMEIIDSCEQALGKKTTDALRALFIGRYSFLQSNPGYRSMPAGVRSSKKVHASQVVA
jgi:hypothetical protein